MLISVVSEHKSKLTSCFQSMIILIITTCSLFFPRLSEAADIVHLYHLIHPDCKSAGQPVDSSQPLEIIKVFILLNFLELKEFKT